jgi:hypothetical protein
MTSFVHTNFRNTHPGVDRMESAVGAAKQLGRGYDSTRGLAAMLLAAIVAAMLVVADQIVVTWADGHLLAAWIAMWVVGFAALALFAGTARRVAIRAIAVADAWSHQVALKRADERLWSIAQKDPRVMADLQAALSRNSEEAPVSAPIAPVASFTAVASEMPFAEPEQRRFYGYY